VLGTFKTERRQRAVYERDFKYLFPTFEAWRASIEAARKRRSTAKQHDSNVTRSDAYDEWLATDIQDPNLYG
jgi:hypothetical protein